MHIFIIWCRSRTNYPLSSLSLGKSKHCDSLLTSNTTVLISECHLTVKRQLHYLLERTLRCSADTEVCFYYSCNVVTQLLSCQISWHMSSLSVLQYLQKQPFAMRNRQNGCFSVTALEQPQAQTQQRAGNQAMLCQTKETAGVRQKMS